MFNSRPIAHAGLWRFTVNNIFQLLYKRGDKIKHTIDQHQQSGQLDLRARLGYGIGEAGLNFLVAGVSTYLLFFYTEVFGIAAGAAGLLILIARAWDAANDPIMGAIVDRTHTRWGQSRPYILFIAAPVAILTVLIFTTPPLGPTGKLIWAYSTFILWGMAFTAIAVPYNALMANLTTDFAERTSLGALKTIFAVIGSLLVIVLTKPMTESLANTPQAGFTVTFAIFGALAFVIFIICFALTQEHPGHSTPTKFELRQFRNVIGNRELMILIGFFLLFQVAFSLFRTIELFYFKYVLHREGLFATTMLLAHLAAIAGMALTPLLAKRLGKKGAALLGGVIGCLHLFLMFLVPGRLWLIILNISASYLWLSAPYALFFGMVPDTVEYGQWKTGIRSAGLIFSVFTFTQKLGMALAAAFASWGLVQSGYIADQLQTPAAEHGILLMRTLAPALLVAAGMVLFLFYRLGRTRHERILSELKMREQPQAIPPSQTANESKTFNPPVPSLSETTIAGHLDALYRLSTQAGGLEAGVRLNAAGAQAAEYLCQQFKQAGAANVRLQEFPVTRWWPEKYQLATEVDGVVSNLPAFPLWYCTGYGPGTLELVDGGGGTRGELRGKDLQGKAVLIRMRRIFHFIPTFEKLGTLAYLVQKGAAAVIVMDDLLDTPSGMLAVTHREIMDCQGRELKVYPLPAVSIGRATGQILLDQLAAGPVTIQLHLEPSVTSARASNVIAEIPGNGQSREVILIGGHYDTWFGGALDNLCSQAGILELVRHFAAVPLEQRARTLMFAGIFGHEFGNQGHAALAAELEPIRDRITCFLDVDGSGSTGWEVDAEGRIFATGLNDVCGIVASSNALARLATEALYEQDIFSFRLANHMQIADLDGPLTELGIPTLLIIGKHLFYHSPLDTPERIPIEIVQRRMAVNLRIISTLLASPAEYFIATNANPFRDRFPAGPRLADLEPDDLPVNPRPWTDGPPRDLCFEVFPAQPRVLSPVIVWRGHAVSEGINRGDDIQWCFGSFISWLSRKSRRGGASGTMYLIPGTKVIRMTVTDRHGRSSSIERRIQVTW